MSIAKKKLWVVVPAAGQGRRMNAAMPKQYFPLQNETVLEQTLKVLSCLDCEAICVVLDDDDRYFEQLNITKNKNIDKKLYRVSGGSERCYSVLNALKFLQEKAHPNDWILVHDAARPCVELHDILTLLHELEHNPAVDGGILAIPVNDSIKSVQDKRVSSSLDRSVLWRAQTPQVFSFDVLFHSLSQALTKGIKVSDEAMAVELAGHEVMICEGRATNLKITRENDLEMASLILQSNNAQHGEEL